jgi:WD40 repeat protein
MQAPLLHRRTSNKSAFLFMQVYQLDGTELATVSSAESGSGFKCSTFGASSISDPQLAVGSFDGRLQLWDLENLKAPLWDTQAHASIVNGIDGCGGQVGAAAAASQQFPASKVVHPCMQSLWPVC